MDMPAPPTPSGDTIFYEKGRPRSRSSAGGGSSSISLDTRRNHLKVVWLLQDLVCVRDVPAPPARGRDGDRGCGRADQEAGPEEDGRGRRRGRAAQRDARSGKETEVECHWVGARTSALEI
jgi:hypothetical protein